METIIHKNKTHNGSLSPSFTLLLKGLCCLLVGFHHYARIKVEQFGSINPLWMLLAHHGGNIGVGLFFFLSGYGLQESAYRKRLSVKEIVRYRFWKIYWPLLVVNVVFVILTTSLKDIDLWDLFINFKSIDLVLWFIEILFGCYIVFYYAQSIADNTLRNITLYGLGALLLIIVMILRPEHWWHYTNIPMFFIGVLYSQCKKTVGGIFRFRLWHFSVSIVALGILSFVLWSVFHSWWSFFCISVISLLLVLLFVRYFDISPSFHSRMGKISYEYYIVHNKLLAILLSINFLPPPILFALISIALAVLIHITLHGKKSLLLKR